MNTDLMFASKTPEHFTPPWLLDEVEKVAPIGLDPCAHPKAEASKRAKVLISQHPLIDFVTKGLHGSAFIVGKDGLIADWRCNSGELAFWNPPYGRELAKWVAKGAAEACPQIALVPARVDTAWWRTLDPLVWCALSGRLKFWHLPHSWDDAIREASTGEHICLNCKVLASEAETNCPAAEPVEAESSAPFPSAVCLLHAPYLVDRFVEVFSKHGVCYSRV